MSVLAATEALLSLLCRPAAGVLADRFDRARVAAVGAILFGLSLFGYALANNLGVAFGAAVCNGIGCGLFWVAPRARVGEQLRDDAAVFSRLLAAEGTGIGIGFLIALTLLDNDRCQLVFATAGAACLLAAVLLLSSPTQTGGRSRTQADLRQVTRRLRPLLVVVAVTATVEFGVSLLLLLHLQRGFGLTVGQLALVFRPGFVILTALPLRLYAVVRRIGRAATLTSSLVASAVVAVGLAFAAPPVVIGALWAISAACLAAAIPVEQVVAAEASDGSLRRGMGICGPGGDAGGGDRAIGAATAAPPLAGRVAASLDRPGGRVHRRAGGLRGTQPLLARCGRERPVHPAGGRQRRPWRRAVAAGRQ